jgi:UDPglucose 6-dehydrogenase
MLVRAVEDVNRFQEDHLVRVVLEELEGAQPPVAGILGLAFKNGTAVTVGSPALTLARRLLDRGIRVIGFDPLAADAARAELGDGFETVDTVADLVEGCGVCVVTYRSEAFKEALESCRPEHALRVVDCWRQLAVDRMASGIRVRPMGRCVEPA